MPKSKQQSKRQDPDTDQAIPGLHLVLNESISLEELKKLAAHGSGKSIPVKKPKILLSYERLGPFGRSLFRETKRDFPHLSDQAILEQIEAS